MTQRALAFRLAAVSTAALMVLAGCGDDKKDTASQPQSTPAATTASTPSTDTEPSAEASTDPSAAANATTIDIDMTEFMLKVDKTTLTAGTYTFNATNSGTIPHEFQIDGPGVEDKGTGVVQPGDDGSVTVTLQKGTYTFYCPLPGHEDKGMKQEVTVT